MQTRWSVINYAAPVHTHTHNCCEEWCMWTAYLCEDIMLWVGRSNYEDNILMVVLNVRYWNDVLDE